MEECVGEQPPQFSLSDAHRLVAQQIVDSVGAFVVATRDREKQHADGDDSDRQMGKPACGAAHEVHGFLPLLASSFDNGRYVVGRKRRSPRQVPSGLLQFAQSPAGHPMDLAGQVNVVETDVIMVARFGVRSFECLGNVRPTSRDSDEQEPLLMCLEDAKEVILNIRHCQ